MPAFNMSKIDSIFSKKLFYLGDEFQFSELSAFASYLYEIPIRYADMALSKARKNESIATNSEFLYALKYIKKRVFQCFCFK